MDYAQVADWLDSLQSGDATVSDIKQAAARLKQRPIQVPSS